MNLADLFPAGKGTELRTAVVESVDVDGVTITISGGSVPGVARQGWYTTPVVGDVVQVLAQTDQSTTRYLILGTVI